MYLFRLSFLILFLRMFQFYSRVLRPEGNESKISFNSCTLGKNKWDPTINIPNLYIVIIYNNLTGNFVN